MRSLRSSGSVGGRRLAFGPGGPIPESATGRPAFPAPTDSWGPRDRLGQIRKMGELQHTRVGVVGALYECKKGPV